MDAAYSVHRPLMALQQKASGEVHCHKVALSGPEKGYPYVLCPGAAGPSGGHPGTKGRGRKRSLLPLVPGPQKIRGLEASNGLDLSQRPHNAREVQDGVPPVHPRGCPPGRLDAVCGPEGRILSRPNSQRFPEIPKVRCRLQAPTICLSALRPYHLASHLFQSAARRGSTLESKGPAGIPLPGRSPAPLSKQTTAAPPSGIVTFHPEVIRVDDKFGEKSAVPISISGVSGGSLQHREGDYRTTRGEASLYPRETKGVPPFLLPASPQMSGPSGHNGLHHSDGEVGPMANAAISDRLPSPVEVVQPDLSDSDFSGDEAVNPVVAAPTQPQAVPLPAAGTLDDSYLRRQQSRLGCPLRISSGSGRVGFPDRGHRVQYPGAPRGLPSHLGLCATPKAVLSTAKVGQHHRSGVHQKARGDSQQVPATRGGAYLELGPTPPGQYISGLYPRGPEYTGGRTVQEFSDRRRVVPQRRGVQLDCLAGSHARGRPLRHPFQQEAPKVLFKVQGPSGLRHGCPIGPLALPGGLRVPTNSADCAVFAEAEEGTGDGPGGDSPVAQQALVPPAIPPQSVGPSTSATQARPPLVRGSSPPTPGLSEVTGLVVERERLLAAGCPRSVIPTLLNARRPGTNQVYNRIWAKFVELLDSRGSSHTSPSITDVLLFLQAGLDLGLAVSTLKVHISALSAFSGHGWASERLVRQFLKGAARIRPQYRSRFPKWDLPLVLDFLSRFPEPGSEPLSAKQLSVKTAFLVAITSAKRVSEIHNLGAVAPYITFFPDRVVLVPMLGARPKVTSVFHQNPEITLPTYCPPSSSDAAPHPLDVGRTLSEYLTLTAPFRQSDHLFVLLQGKNRGKAASSRTIASWIILAVQWAYRASGLTPPEAVSAHSTRSIATSWAAARRVSPETICKAASWASIHTFMSHYCIEPAALSSVSFGSSVLSANNDH